MCRTYNSVLCVWIIMTANANVFADAQTTKAARQFAEEFTAKVRPLETATNLAWWDANMTGKDEDYGHGFDELKMEKHGHEHTFRYGKANSIPEVKLDVTKPLDGQLASISQQMVDLMNGPVTKQIDAQLKKNRIVSPFDVDVQVDGKTVNLAKAKPGSLTPDFVNTALFEVVKQHTFKNVRADIAAYYGVHAPVGTTVNVTSLPVPPI